jgi:hypothetical protein
MESIPWIVIIVCWAIYLFIRKLKSIHVGPVIIELHANDGVTTAFPEPRRVEVTKPVNGYIGRAESEEKQQPTI